MLPPPMRILLAPFGSEGDVNPLLWLAEGLQQRGHEVLVMLTPHYGHLADRRNLRWVPVGTAEDFEKFARDPRLWKPRIGTRFVLKSIFETAPAVRATFESIDGDFDLIVTSTIGLVIASLAEARGIPCAMMHMQPMVLQSVGDCPLFMEGMQWLCNSPAFVKRAVFALTDKMVWSMIGRPVNSIRNELGLRPMRSFYHDALHGTEAVGVLFPEWFAPPQPDWPAHIRQLGFPLTLSAPQPIPAEVENFLSAGEPPVVWTHGSANFDIAHFQARAIACSRQLGIRSLLVSLDPPQTALPSNILHVRHVRFEDLFPRCRAVVHHGGIGTMSKVIAAGIPHLVVPRSHDQPDNGHRIEKLGLGRSLSYGKLDSPALARTLSEVLASPAMADSCRRFQKMIPQDPRPAACEWLESVVRSGSKLQRVS